ncbi:MAG: metallophosphoesterase [Clostridia bacterium]
MTIFAVSDLHLSNGDKPMDVFGPQWVKHFEKIADSWRALVKPGDVVLLPGDLSWAMQLEEAIPHLQMVGELPGRKILIKGNHDYWWGAISRVRRALPTGMYAIQNDALALDGALFAGTRGWLLPSADAAQDDVRIYERELLRLEMSLVAARKLDRAAPLYCMLHYPPCTASQQDTGFTRLLETYQVNTVVYGHLHDQSLKYAFSGVRAGIAYHCVSCDGLDFSVKQIAPPCAKC